MAKRPKDARSTGRRRGRRVLERTGRRYACECRNSEHDWHSDRDICDWSPEEQSRSSTLDVNHKNKNILDNDPANLEWLCRKCHKHEDKQTAKGVMSEKAEAALYGDLFGDL